MNRKIVKSKVDLTKVNKYFKNASCFPKNMWPKEALANKALYDCRWCSQREKFIFMSRNHPKFNQFIEKFVEHNYVIKAESDIISYGDIITYAYENKEAFGTKRMFIDTPAYIVECDKAKLMFMPYNDGIELLQINVKPEFRNQGIGTQIINDLYDISEEMNIELYLHPYPDDNFTGGAKEEIKRINRLRKYYERLGFGPTKDNPKMYSNMELA